MPTVPVTFPFAEPVICFQVGATTAGGFVRFSFHKGDLSGPVFESASKA